MSPKLFMNAGTPFHKAPYSIHGINMPSLLLPEGEEHPPVVPNPSPSTITVPALPVPAPPERVFSAADIEKARQEEKDKVYGRLSTFEQQLAESKNQLEALTAAKQKEIDAAAAAAKKAAEEEAAKRFEESDAKSLLAEADKKWADRFAAFETDREAERATFAKERVFNELKTYAGDRVQEALRNNEIAPELADFVSGNTQDEIDASLNFVKAKTIALVESVRQAQVGARAAMPGVSTAGYSTTGPMDSTPGTKTFSASDIANMSMAEYAQYRSTLLPAASNAQQGRGLYG